MNRNGKKVLSASVAGAILAAQAMMQVAAAGGTINADMSTKSPILRVQVPTKMAVAVNEFEMGDEGSQVTSDEFTMKNLSEVPVNVRVSSEATVGANTVLASSKAAAKSSTDSAMWLAAVAAVNDNSGTLEYTSETDKTVNGLDGTEGNITAFGSKDENNKSTAVQNFYLQGATAATYQGITGAEVDEAKKDSGADYYELTAVTPATDDAAGAATLAATQDIYVSAAVPAAGTPATLTKVVKGTAAADITWTASTSKAFTIAAAPTAAASLDNTKSYLYIDSATTAAGDAAAFRYIGALSESKSGWSTSDLAAIAIQYNITAISTSAYGEVAGDDGSGLTYGYKAEDSKMTLENGVLTVKIKIADFQDGTLKIGDTTGALASSAGRWGGADDAVTFTFNSTWADAMKGKTCVVTVNLKSGDSITASFDVPN